MEPLEIDDTYRLKNSIISETPKDINISIATKVTKNGNNNKKIGEISNILSRKYFLFPLFTAFAIFFVLFIIYLIGISKYEVTYKYTEQAYIKPKYSSHNYSTLTFNNGLKVVLTQVDPDDEAGCVISFDYGYLSTQFEPGYLKLAFLSLINKNISNSDVLTNYFGSFNYDINKYYTSFYFNILGGGFQKYLKTFAALTYLQENDERFNLILNQTLSVDTSSQKEKKDHLLQYLVYGYINSNGRDFTPQGNSDTIKELNGNVTSIIKIMKTILNDPSKIKIVLFSHYKMSVMKKYFMKYFSDLINRPKISNDNLLNVYNLTSFNTNQLIYDRVGDNDHFYIEINYFLTKRKNATYNQLIKDSQYLLYIIYILNQTNSASLYHELNNFSNNIKINSVSSDYEIILKNKIKFTINVELNHFSYCYSPEIIHKVFNYMNKIRLYMNDYNNAIDDNRLDELDTINDQNFSFIEDAHEINYYKIISQALFYKDNKTELLRQMMFSKKDFNENINVVKYYFNQLTMNNSVVFLHISKYIRDTYNLSSISDLFTGTSKTKSSYSISYSTKNLSSYFNQSFDNDYQILLNPEKNEYISKYNSSSDLEYNPEDYENYFKMPDEEIGVNNNYLKVFFKKDTSLKTPRIFIKIFFFHPFFRPNCQDITDSTNLYYGYLLFYSYLKLTIEEKLADALRAGGNFFHIFYNENFIYLDIFILSDIAIKVMKIIKNIIYDQDTFISKLKDNFEIYRDEVYEYFLNSGYCSRNYVLKYEFFETITGSKNNKDDNLPPIFNICKLNYSHFKTISLREINFVNLQFDSFSIKYIFVFGYYNKSDAEEIYNLFNIPNNFNIALQIANLSHLINDSNFVEWILYKPSININQNVTANIEKYAYKYILFTQYDLKTSCLAELLRNIFSEMPNMVEKNIVVYLLSQKYIYLRFSYPKDLIIPNDEFMDNLTNWLDQYNEMKKTVDVIGDRFYYQLKGNKIKKAITHFNVNTSAFHSIYATLYDDPRNNNKLNFNMDKYEDFVDEIKKYIHSGKSYVDIYPIK